MRSEMGAETSPTKSHSDLDANRQKHRAQSGISGKLKLRTGPGVMLVPSALETDAEQLLLPGLSTVPIQDSSTNVFRGSVKPVVEQMLDDDSAANWPEHLELMLSSIADNGGDRAL